jgi:hypothetical protein
VFHMVWYCKVHGHEPTTDRESTYTIRRDVLCPSLEGKSSLYFVGILSSTVVYVNMNKI